MSQQEKNTETQEKTSQISKRWIYVRWLLLRLALVIYDVLAVNASVYLALFTRLYVAHEFHAGGLTFLASFHVYAPVYSLFCVIIFALFRLYSGIWKYAGFDDFNRILYANIVAFIGHITGTLLFGFRMPISVYCISAVILLVLICVSRFSYRILIDEKRRVFAHNAAQVNAVLVGVGRTAQFVIRQLEHECIVHPVCMLNYKESKIGLLYDGVPVVSGVGNLKNAIKKYNAELVILASTVIPEETRNEIVRICGDLDVEVQDFSGFFRATGSDITLRKLAECSKGKIELVANDQHRVYDDAEQALMNTDGRYTVKGISAKNDVLLVELADNSVVQNDLNADWVKSQQQETGEEISFF